MTSTQRVVDAQHADALLTWYSANKRDLPWRDAADPYLVLVSEVMLQQTQASRVVPFYRDFIARFPTVESLAAATLSAVLDAWSGLGYHSRAKRLRDAATKISESGWPRTLDGLLELPGVGPYTAAAIACFAMGEAVATADTNARRVISRWRGVALEGAALKRAAAEELRSPAATWNQAIMDLGATICLPTNPRCDACPVEQWCCGPAAYRPPRSQSLFSGSTRQARGVVVRSLLAGTHPSSLVRETGLSEHRVEKAIDGLVRDGIVAVSASGDLTLADS